VPSLANLYIRRDVKERQNEAVKEFPSAVDYNPSDIVDPDANMSVMFARILLQLEKLQNLFLIARLLSKHGETDEDLLPISFELVSLTLLFWTHKDRFAPFRNDFEWLVGQPFTFFSTNEREKIFTNAAVVLLGHGLCNAKRGYPLYGIAEFYF
jgi:hypothetical protein